MVDYSKYTHDKWIRKPKTQMDELELETYDAEVAREARQIYAKLHNNSGQDFASSVVLKLASEILDKKKSKQQGEDNNDLL